MRTITIAALAAAQLTAVPAMAADRAVEETAAQQAPLDRAAALSPGEGEPAAARAAAAQADEPRKKKRKSTGDKILTGAAVVLGIGALAVGGLLVAIFVG